MTDNIDEAEEIFKTTAENVSHDMQHEEMSFCNPTNFITNDDCYSDKSSNNILAVSPPMTDLQSTNCDLLRNVVHSVTSAGDQQCEKLGQNATHDKHLLTFGPSISHPKDQKLSACHLSLPSSYTSSASTSSISPSSMSSSSLSLSSSLLKNDHSDSDSGVSDLSTDLTFYKNNSKFCPTLNYTSKESQVSSQNIDLPKKSKINKKYPDLFQSRKLVQKMQDNFHQGLIYWAKLVLLLLVFFFLIILTFIVSHVKCFNDICAISLETKIHYYKYASPI